MFIESSVQAAKIWKNKHHTNRPGISAKQLANLAALATVAEHGRPALAVEAPFTGEKIGLVPACTPADVQAALQRARTAQQAWANYPLAKRQKILLRCHDLALAHRSSLLDLIQLESGKARRYALDEILDVALTCRHYAYRAKTYLKPRRRRGALPLFTATREHRQPVGLVGMITPWNYPFALVASDAIPALLAGNAVIVKPAEQTPFSALRVLALLQEAGLPPDLFQVVTGYGPQLGPALINGVDYLSFTGSTKTGRIVAAQAGQRLINYSLELGGKNPMLVLNDAPLQRTVEGAIQGCFSNGGQLCLSIERLYVQSGLYDPFLRAFVARTQGLHLSASLDDEAEVGSLISGAHLAKVQEHVQDAVNKGAVVLAGGQARPDIGPYFYQPTILAGVTPDMKIAQEETFGPVVSVYRFEEVEEALRLANQSTYGLNASIWSRNTRRAQKLAARLRCGMANINEAYTAAWASIDAPMGGMKESGVGRRHGREGILKYTEAQTISLQRGLALAPPPGLSLKSYARLVTTGLRLMRYIPGLR